MQRRLGSGVIRPATVSDSESVTVSVSARESSSLSCLVTRPAAAGRADGRPQPRTAAMHASTQYSC